MPLTRVKLIAQTANVHIVNDSMAHDQPGNYVALSLKSLNIRDALDSNLYGSRISRMELLSVCSWRWEKKRGQIDLIMVRFY